MSICNTHCRMKPPPSAHEKSVLDLSLRRGLLRARDFSALDVPTVVLTRLVRAGKLERIGRGVYMFPDAQISEHHSHAEVALRAPRGVICLLTALRVHEIGTQSPFQLWLALPTGTKTPRIDYPPIRAVHMSGQSYSEGIEFIQAEGVSVPIFNAAKTVADCFKFRNKVGLDVALEALREGWRERKFTMDDLWRYAELNRVSKVIRPYMESLT